MGDENHNMADVLIALIEAAKDVTKTCLTSPWFMVAVFVWLGYLNREQFFNLLSTVAGK